MINKLILVASILGLGAGVVLSKTGNDNTAIPASTFVAGKPQNPAINLTPPHLADRVGSGDLPRAKILLSKNNTVIFRAAVDGLSVGKAQAELLSLDKKLPRGQDIFLVLDTPGGDIVSGNQLIDTTKSLNRKVHTITIFAASMGFAFAQRMDNRYIIPSGTLMAHRARVGGVEGQIPGEFITAAATLYNLVLGMERQNANRMGIDLDTYTSLVKDEYWVDGEEAVRQGVADSLALIQCDASLDGTSFETVDTFFGPVQIEWANCPAITQPIGFKFPEMPGRSEEEKLTTTKNIKELLSARRKMWGAYLK